MQNSPEPPVDASPFAIAYAEAQQRVADPKRLAAVHATGLLDSEIEEAFERLTRLAVRLVKVPAAFVSLVDERRDFYKSACGFGEPLASARQLEGPTFCHFTVRSEKPLVIPDTRADPVYRAVPTVQSLGVAAYIGIPILVNEEVIGAFCAIDVVPHDWSADEIATLEELAAVAVSEISLRAARAEADRFRRDAVAANEAKGEFLAAMSHDLRTPLGAIGGYAQLLEMGVHGPLNAPQLEAVGRIENAQRHLLSLIDDLLQFAKAESGTLRLDLQQFLLVRACSPLETMVTPLAATKGVQFSCDLNGSGGPGALSAVADVERLVQILVNLAGNAIKFTAPDGRVHVTGRRLGDWIEVIVEDNGVGIAANQLEHIFDPFVQLGEGRGAREGVGLGLATSRVLARRMGGDILVESTPGVGSRFTVRLPAAVAAD